MSTDWLFWGSALLAALIGAALLLWALFSDRSRGRKRCPKCWYDMDRSPTLRCSECGHEVQRERKLFKTRRRWRWVVVSAGLLLLSGSIAGYRVTQTESWASLIPNTVLIAGFRYGGSEGALDLLLEQDGINDGVEAFLFMHPFAESPQADNGLYQWQWRWLADSLLLRCQEDEPVLSLESSHLLRLVFYIGHLLDDDDILDRAYSLIVLQLDWVYDILESQQRDFSPPRGAVDALILESIDLRDPAASADRVWPFVNSENLWYQKRSISTISTLAIENEVAARRMIEMLSHHLESVRHLAMYYLGRQAIHESERERLWQTVQPMYKDESPRVRMYWPRVMRSKLSDEEMLALQLELLLTDDPGLRLGVLGTVHDLVWSMNPSDPDMADIPEQFIEGIVRALTFDDAKVVSTAVDTLALIPVHRACRYEPSIRAAREQIGEGFSQEKRELDEVLRQIEELPN
ncbi:MAG: hypothetical protein EA377_00150 [Phycisphaerales bacterium]|nr:MAG: hypothetical protein EA377_00150 [Phycisphaerales bacterium]